MVGSLAAVDASAPGDLWAVGSRLAASGVSRAVATHWDGVTWESVRPAAPLPGRYVSTVFADVPTFGRDAVNDTIAARARLRRSVCTTLLCIPASPDRDAIQSPKRPSEA
jgi:hypothetical protein